MQIQILQVLRNGFHQHGRVVFQPGLVEKRGNGIGVAGIGRSNEEMLAFMLRADQVHHRLGRSGTVENLALAIDDVLLKIHRDHIRRAEILHGLGNLDTHLLGQFEIGVNGMAGGKHDGSIIRQIDALGTKFTSSKRFYEEKPAEFNIDTVFFVERSEGSQVQRLLLRNQYLLNFHILPFVLNPHPSLQEDGRRGQQAGRKEFERAKIQKCCERIAKSRQNLTLPN